MVLLTSWLGKNDLLLFINCLVRNMRAVVVTEPWFGVGSGGVGRPALSFPPHYQAEATA